MGSQKTILGNTAVDERSKLHGGQESISYDSVVICAKQHLEK